MSEESTEPPVPAKAASGRPRDPAIDDRVLAAARASLVEVGWDATSIRGIAERAGVSRPAIARRWPSKTHLVLEALLGAEPNMVPFEGVDLRGWIDGVVDGSFELFGREDMQSAMPGLLATLRDHDDLRAAMWDGFVGPATELAVDQGAAAAKVARAAIAVAAGAALFASVMVGDDPALMASVRSLVSDALVSSLVERDD